jgi:hypothetical protein
MDSLHSVGVPIDEEAHEVACRFPAYIKPGIHGVPPLSSVAWKFQGLDRLSNFMLTAVPE